MTSTGFITARRTRVRPGLAAEYARVHARIPAAVEAALRASGVVRWQIFADGDTLFHVIETRDGYERMVADITALGPIDEPWDDVVASLLESDAASDRLLAPVWSMDADGQYEGGSIESSASIED